MFEYESIKKKQGSHFELEIEAGGFATSEILVLLGENGTGKSTLVEAIAINLGFNPEGGSKNFQFATKETHSNLFDYLTIERWIEKYSSTLVSLKVQK